MTKIPALRADLHLRVVSTGLAHNVTLGALHDLLRRLANIQTDGAL